MWTTEYVCRLLMSRCLTRRLLLICVFLSCSGLFVFNRWALTKTVFNAASRMFIRHENYSGYLVETKQCRIPNIDPFDPSITMYLRVTIWGPCPSRQSLTYQNGDVLRLNRTLIEYYHGNHFKMCKYYPIVRDSVNDDTFYILKAGVDFNNDVAVKYQFIKVLCFDTSNVVIYTNYHAYVLHANITQPKRLTKVDKIRQVLSKNSVQLKSTPLNKTSLLTTVPTPTFRPQRTVPEVKVKLNVLLVGVDSMSRLNFMRQMSRTRSYLLETMGAFDMAGYNKVADNTFVNLVPILAGKYVEDLPWNETLNKQPFDKYEFMWDRYKEYGFATLFAEDAPGMAAFNYAKSGFHKKPTDHYYRPFALAVEADPEVRSADSHCIRDRMEAEMVLQYTYDFARVYKNDQYFGLTFISRLTHDDINNAGRGDLVYLKFFQKLHEDNLLKNTILFFFSDHGIRFGNFRKTYIGKIEERLPFMLIVPPAWLIRRYPNVWGNMKVNTHRLTTPFDIHETLMASLDIDTAAKNVDKQIANSFPTRKKTRYSLFTRVPYERTCEDATILTHWCSCHQLTQIDVNDGKIIRAAEDLVKKLNQLLYKLRQKCVILKLNKILDASLIGANDELLRFQDSVNDVIDRQVYFGKPAESTKTDYQLTIETTPGLAHFEASLRHEEGTDMYTLLGDISRTNLIGRQADCIDNAKLQKYCCCHEKED